MGVARGRLPGIRPGGLRPGADDETNGCSQRPGFRPQGDGRILSHYEELTVAGRVGRTSVIGQQERATYMVILGEHIEAGALPSCGTPWGPAPARSVSRSCSRVGPLSNNYSVVGRGAARAFRLIRLLGQDT